MSPRQTVQKTFANFWNIDLGHIVIAITFLVGLVGAWEKMGAKVEAVMIAQANQRREMASSLQASTTERNLKFAAIESRIARAEADVRTVGDVKTSVAVVTSELKSLSREISALRSEIKEQVSERRPRGL